MRSYVLNVAAIGLASGICFRSFFYIPYLPLLSVCASLVLLMYYAALHKRMSVPHAVYVSILLVTCALGVVRSASVQNEYEEIVNALRENEGQKITVEGVVVRDTGRSDTGLSVYIKVHTIGEVSIKTVVQATLDPRETIVYGDRLMLEGVFDRPKAFKSGEGRVFFYEEYLRAQGVSHVLSFARLEEKETDTSFSFFKLLYGVKKSFMHGIQVVLPEPHAGFGEGLLLGEKHALGKTYEEIFRKAGIIHIVVLSGYNLAVVGEALLFLLSGFFVPRKRAFISILFIFLFALAVGLSATVVRAALMASLVLLARVYGKTYFAIIGLSFACIVMILWNPYVLMFDPGFQLSFLATLGLIFGAPIIEKLLEQFFYFKNPLYGLREIITSTLATQLVVAPLLLFSMGSISLISLVANTLVLVCVPITMLCVFVAGLCGVAFGSYGIVCGYPAYLFLSYILFVAERSSMIPFATITVYAFSLIQLILAYTLLIGIGICLYQKSMYKNKSL